MVSKPKPICTVKDIFGKSNLSDGELEALRKHVKEVRENFNRSMKERRRHFSRKMTKRL